MSFNHQHLWGWLVSLPSRPYYFCFVLFLHLNRLAHRNNANTAKGEWFYNAAEQHKVGVYDNLGIFIGKQSVLPAGNGLPALLTASSPWFEDFPKRRGKPALHPLPTERERPVHPLCEHVPTDRHLCGKAICPVPVVKVRLYGWGSFCSLSFSCYRPQGAVQPLCLLVCLRLSISAQPCNKM